MSDQTQKAPAFYALLIGIDQYLPNILSDGSHYASLNGCVRDIALVGQFLKEKLKLTDDHIFTLTAPNDAPASPAQRSERLPTYENITAALRSLTVVAQTGDQVYIHYSGHGGRTQTLFPQLKGKHGLDEALVPTDIGLPSGQYLRDVELAYILKAMVDKGLIVTVVLDSCHSGGATRGQSGATVRGLSAIDRTPRPAESKIASYDALLQVYSSFSAGTASQASAGSGWVPDVRGYVLLAACRASESAYEYAFAGQEKHGALTYWLLDSLKQPGTGLTYRQLHNRLIAKIHSQFEAQTPQLEGEGNRLVFGSAYAQRADAVNVMKFDRLRQQVVLNTGRAQAVDRGAQFAVYAPDTADFQVSDRLAIVEVIKAGATDSRAKVIERFQPGAIEQGAQAILLDPGVIRLRRTVRLLHNFPSATGIQERALVEVEQALAASRFVEVVTGNAADYQVVVNERREYEIWDPAGAAIPNLRPALTIDDPAAPRQLVKRLEHLTKYRTIQHLDNTAAPSLQGKLVVELVRGADAHVFDGAFTILAPDEQLTVRIRNNSSQVLNVTVLDMGPDWSISQLYPADASSYISCDPGQEIYSQTLKTELPHGYSDAKDILKVFATIGSTNFRWLELPALDQPQQSRGMHGRPTNALEELLFALAVDEPRSRQLSPAVNLTQEWITAQVEVRVRRS